MSRYGRLIFTNRKTVFRENKKSMAKTDFVTVPLGILRTANRYP